VRRYFACDRVESLNVHNQDSGQLHELMSSGGFGLLVAAVARVTI